MASKSSVLGLHSAGSKVKNLYIFFLHRKCTLSYSSHLRNDIKRLLSEWCSPAVSLHWKQARLSEVSAWGAVSVSVRRWRDHKPSPPCRTIPPSTGSLRQSAAVTHSEQVPAMTLERGESPLRSRGVCSVSRCQNGRANVKNILKVREKEITASDFAMCHNMIKQSAWVLLVLQCCILRHLSFNLPGLLMNFQVQPNLICSYTHRSVGQQAPTV